MSKDSQINKPEDITDVSMESAGPMPIDPPVAAPEAIDPSKPTLLQAVYIKHGDPVPAQKWYQKLWSKRPFRDSVHRATNTFAQTVLASSAVSGVVNGGVEDVAWSRVISIAGLATIMSLLQSVRRYTKTDDE